MLFNSYIFILVFLPIVLLGFYKIGGSGHHRMAIVWLVLASLFFYGWWNPVYIGLLIGSVLFNYSVGIALGNRDNPLNSKISLAFGVFFNLSLLGYFKYTNFLIDNINTLPGTSYHMNKIVLPLAISFFTFQQIAYLVSAYRGETREYNFLHYCLFVTFFPQLIAGPIVHHKEMLPQFANKAFFHRKHENLAVGLTIFFIGLFKKVILADGMAVYATPVFDAAARGVAVTFFDTWGGVLAYTFQLYFDFSGYSDMAVGLGRMFGIRLPINFHSPYKAVNIIDFWRRWHITLSRFLREYLYFSLGGNRKGPIRRFLNLMITMLLGGLWHGAGWTFVAWGGLHGLYLVINHCWRSICSVRASGVESGHWWGRALSKLLTFTAVVVAWVFFRADSFDAAVGLLQGMAGLNGCILPESYFHRLGPLGPIFASIGCRFEHSELFAGVTQISFIAVLLIIAWYAPNTQQLMANFQPGLPVYKFDAPIRGWQSFRWHPTPSWAALTAVLTLWTLVSLSKTSEFLYFQF